MQLSLDKPHSAELARRRQENVKALELKHQQMELESVRRSEAVEAARREQLRKQRQAEAQLQQACDAADTAEQARARTAHEARESERLQQLEAERRRIEAVQAEEAARVATRARHLRDAEEAAERARAEEARLASRVDASASEHMKMSFDRILSKLDFAIATEQDVIDRDTAARRRQRQLAAESETALTRVQALEQHLIRERERNRCRARDQLARRATENLDERFRLGEQSPEQTRAALLLGAVNNNIIVSAGGGGAASSNSDAAQQQRADRHGSAAGAADHASSAAAAIEARRQSAGTGGATPALGDFQSWSKQRAVEAELVELALEYDMRTGGVQPL